MIYFKKKKEMENISPRTPFCPLLCLHFLGSECQWKYAISVFPEMSFSKGEKEL